MKRGSQSGEETAYEYHEKFDIDERVLALGVESEVKYFLSRHVRKWKRGRNVFRPLSLKNVKKL